MKNLKVLFLSFILLINIQLLFADFNSLKEAVESEESNKEYSFAGIQTIEDDLGELKGISLTINGTQNINSVINSTGTYGINLLSSSSAQTLVVNNVSGFNNFKSAIVNKKNLSSVIVNNSVFNENKKALKGSAIYNLGYLEVNNSTFTFNSSSYGGAIINGDGASSIAQKREAHFSNVLFENNIAQTGGAVFNDVKGSMYMNNVVFSTNTSTGRDDKYAGGAVVNKGTMIITDYSNFTENKSNISGGAIENSGILNIYGFTHFIANSATQTGGAIFNSDYKDESIYTNTINISSGALFKDNSAKNGGAIDNDGALFLTANTHAIAFINNSASNFGGAIYNHIYSTVNLKTTDTNYISFNNNTATGKGGAIYNESGILNLIADNANIRFTGNSANDISNAIHTSSGIINLWASEKADIIFNDRITSENNTSVLNINSSTTTLIANGKITLNEDMSGYTGTVNLYDGTLELKENNKFFNTDKFTIYGGTFTANASNILKGFVNNGTVNFTGGTSNNEIIGTGKTEITGNVINNVNIIQSTITVLSGTLEHNIGNGENAAIMKSTYVIVNSEATLIAHSEIDTHTNNGKILNNGLINIDVRGEDEYIGNVKNYNVFEGEGELKITSTTFENYASIMQKKIVIADIDSELTTDLSNLIVTKDITNDGSLILIGNGTNNNWIKGSGTTIIDGEVLNSSTIANSVTINTQKKLTTKVDEITGVIENNGELVFNNDGTNNNWISGNGTTIIDGEIINSSTIANSVTINTQKKLTTKVDEITGVIENNGELVFNNDGTNNNWISGNGTTIIDGEIINSSTIANTVTINTQKKLTTKVDEITGVIENNGELVFNNDGTNNNWISGNGTTIIDGEIINSSTIANSVTINTQKKLTTNASDLTGNILNNGTLNFIGGINNNTVSGVNGTLVINDNLENNYEIVQSSVTINGIVTNKSSISAENIYLNGTFNLDANGSFFTATNVTACDGAEISLQNDLIQEHNFGNLTINSGLVNLVVDTDLENKKMDTISANEESSINGKIKVKAINILTDTKNFKTEILFTSSTVLKDKIETIDTVVSSKMFKYNVNYDENTGKFNFLLTTKPSPVVLESLIAGNIGGAITQINIIGQAFTSLDNNSARYYSSKHQNFKSPNLYVSTANQIFETENKIERGLWIRPYAVQETVSFDNNDVDNTAIGTLAGIDLALNEESLVSFYLGYSGSNQKYEDIKINQTGYIVGATGMLVKEKWYAGITANINFNKASSESSYGTDDFDMNMYSIGAKAGYNFDIGKNWMLESNIMLMYGNINTQSYETSQGANIDSQSIINIIMEPQIKAKLQLEKGWQPYGLLGYVANMNDKAKIVVDEMTFEFDKIKGYVEYGVGVNKDFINTPWNCYVQATGRSGGRTGFAGNLGVKYKF